MFQLFFYREKDLCVKNRFKSSFKGTGNERKSLDADENEEQPLRKQVTA